jgi:hypothetical protein
MNTIEYINNRINEEYCHEIADKLTDENLLIDYMKTNSVEIKINRLRQLLLKYSIQEDLINSIITEYIPDLIPAGTKGVIRGNKFNEIVKGIVNDIKLDDNLYVVEFEKKCPYLDVDYIEIPDWYVYNKITKKIIIGMNQIDLWNGGQQSNRGTKYIINNGINNENVKLLCVVCNHIKLKNTKNTKNKLFLKGFEKNTICYAKNIHNIINGFTMH